MRAIGIKEFMDRQFDVYEFDGKFQASFAFPEKNFRMLVYGKPGNGKTEFCIQLAKYLSRFGKVYYNSFEQGISKSLQDALVRNDMMEAAGKVIFGDKESFDEMMERLGKRNSPMICLVDSRDYMNLTGQQYKQLVEAHPRKAFVIICWEANQKPKGEHAKAIEFMVDIKVHVRDFVAYPRCRFGGNVPYVIWEERAKKQNRQLKLLNLL